MIELRMKGLPLPLVLSGLVALAPLGSIAYVTAVMHLHVDATQTALAVLCALLPWLARLAGRVSAQATVDDVALHVAGEAIPWNTITKVTERRTWRRTTLVVDRGRTSRITLVTRDLFAGRLEPLDELKRRLPALP